MRFACVGDAAKQETTVCFGSTKADTYLIGFKKGAMPFTGHAANWTQGPNGMHGEELEMSETMFLNASPV